MSLVAEAFVDPSGSVEEELKRLKLKCSQLVVDNSHLRAENSKLRIRLDWSTNSQKRFNNWLLWYKGDAVPKDRCLMKVKELGLTLAGTAPLMAQHTAFMESEPVQDVPSPTVDEAEKSRRALILEVLEMVIKRGDKPAVSGESSLPQGELSKAEPAPEPTQERVEAAERPQITIIMPGEKDGFDEAHRREDLEDRIARKIDESNARILAKMQAEFGTPHTPKNIILIGAGHNDAK